VCQIVRRELQDSIHAQKKHDDEVGVVRREDAHRPPEIEVPQADPPVLVQLIHQQACDQIAGDHEEDVDAELAEAEEIAGNGRHGKPARPGEVREQHHHDGDGAQTVE